MYSRLTRFFIMTTIACLSLESESFSALVAEGTAIAGDKLPAALSDTCSDFTPISISASGELSLAATASNQMPPDGCVGLVFDLSPSNPNGALRFEENISFSRAQVYLSAGLGVSRAHLDMTGHTIEFTSPTIGTIDSTVLIENTRFSISETTLNFLGGQENWDGVSNVNLTNGTVNFNITDPSSSIQTFGGQISIDPDLFAYSSVGTISLGSSVHENPTMKITGLITDGGETSQALFASSPEGINNSEPNFWLTNSSNSWLGGTIVQGSNLFIANSGAFPEVGTTELNLGSSGFGSTLVFQLDSTDTYLGSGDITGDGWGAVFVQSGTVNLSGDMSFVNLNLNGGTTILSGNNTLQELILSPGAELQVSSSDNLYYDRTNYQYAVFQGGTLRVLAGGEAVFTALQAPTLQTASVDTPFSILPETGAVANFHLLQVGSSATLQATEGSGTIYITQLAFLNTGTPSRLDVKGSFSSGTTISSSSTYYNTCVFHSDFSNLYDALVLEGTTILHIAEDSSVGPLSAGGAFVTTGAKLRVEGNLTVQSNNLSVDNESTLTGSGTVRANRINMAGTIRPGSSPTTLTVIGAVHLSDGSIYSQYVEPGAAAGLVVEGAVVIQSGSSLQITPEPGCYLKGGESYVFLTATTLSGTFDRASTGTILLTESLSYTADSITLTVVPTPLSSLATNSNGFAVGSNIDAVTGVGNTSLCSLIASFFPLTSGQIAASLNELQPSELKACAIVQENNAVKVRDTLDIRFQRELDTLHCMKEEADSCAVKTKPFHIWVTGFGDSLHQSSVTYSGNFESGYKESMGGVSLGGDYHFAEVLYAGVLGAYTNSDLKWQYSRGKGTIQSGYAGVYFSAIGKLFYGNAAVLGAWSQYDAHRNIDLPFAQSVAKNSHGGDQILSHVDTGVNLGWKGFTLRPFDSLDYVSQTENAFTETGANSLNLSVHKNNAILLRNELGLNFSGCFCAKGSKWTISPKISWVREVRVKGAELTAEFIGTNESFRAAGYFPSRSLVSPGVNISGNLMKDLLVLDFYYNGELNGNYSDHSYGGQIRFGF